LLTKCLIKAGVYQDSVTLMQTAQELTRLPGVHDAAVVMATEANKALLRSAGMLTPEVEAATPNDLVVVVQAETDQAADQSLGQAAARLVHKPGVTSTGGRLLPRTIRSVLRSKPQSNLAVISVAGPYAAAEAWEALKNGLHVLLFSDNVALADEIALKRYAAERGLWMMGPGCGTAILNGVALGLANALPRGPVGIIAAAGTGLQEVSTLLAREGVGVSQGLGTGGRDLSDAVGGIMMLQGLQALQDDPPSQVLLLLSKRPSAAIAQRVLAQVRQSSKPTVICFLGSDPGAIASPGVLPARTLQEAAYLAAATVQGRSVASVTERLADEGRTLLAQAVELRKRLQPQQKYLRGLFSGGTLAAEALVIWEDIPGDVRSNVALRPELKLKDTSRCAGHCALDLGEEEFTIGRPHPMIDNDLRIRRLQQEGADPEVAVLVLDVVLGYGAHPDPASELGPAIERARQRASQEGRELLVIASVTGTDGDPQGYTRQVQRLREAGAIVSVNNATAARLAGFICAGQVKREG